MLFWEDDQTVVRFAEELTHPLAVFTTGGWIVLASSDELHVYKTEERKIQLAARQKREGRPVAVLATAHPDGFAIVREDGVVEQYQMPQEVDVGWADENPGTGAISFSKTGYALLSETH